MSESEANVLTTPPLVPKPANEHQADLDAEIARQQELDLLTMRVNGPARPTPAEAAEVWPGKVYELALKVRGELDDAGTAREDSAALTAALGIACRRYKLKNGKSPTVKSLRESLRNWDAGLVGKVR
jgi:hypothetical protein